eukprot:2093968-Pyramimonas_sp.AAC.1
MSLATSESGLCLTTKLGMRKHSTARARHCDPPGSMRSNLHGIVRCRQTRAPRASNPNNTSKTAARVAAEKC